MIPTSKDIFLEANGRKVAIVQSYKLQTTKDSKRVEAFGEKEPVGHTEGSMKYKIDVTKVYATTEAIRDGIDFHTLSDFSLVIVKPDKREVFTGCEWTDISEDAKLNDFVAENISISATKRRVDTK